jgi:predicted nucleotidyltransferase
MERIELRKKIEDLRMNNLTKAEILALLAQNKERLAQKYPLKSLALFGSYARGTQVEGSSDIDLLVDFSEPVGMELVELVMDLESILNHRVDVVTYNAVKDRLFHFIKEDLEYV